jgi:hypothetical protein
MKMFSRAITVLETEYGISAMPAVGAVSEGSASGRANGASLGDLIGRALAPIRLKMLKGEGTDMGINNLKRTNPHIAQVKTRGSIFAKKRRNRAITTTSIEAVALMFNSV